MMKLGAAILIVGSVALAGCSADSDDSTAPTESSPSVTAGTVEAVPRPEDLAAMLLSEADLDGGWEVNPWGLPATDRGSIGAGESKFAALVCDDAPDEFRAAVEALHWQAFVHLDREPGEASVEELLWADEPDAAASLYTVLENGLEACMGKLGRIGTPEPLTVPDVGDERTGVVIRVGEPGNERSITYGVLVRDGPVLMSARIVGQVTAEQAEQIITTMADKIDEAARAS